MGSELELVDPDIVDLRGHDVHVNSKVTIFEPTQDFLSDSAPQMAMGLGSECANCGVYVSGWVSKTETGYVLCTVNECEVPNGVDVFTSQVSFPSGRIAFGDDLRYAVGDLGSDVVESYNAAVGRYKVYQAYADKNIAYGFTSNTSPNVYLDTETGDIHVANPAFDDFDEDFKGAPETWELLGSICTDLWAYTIMDADDFAATGAEVKDYGWMKKPEFAEVPAGTYEVTHYSDLKGFDFWSSDLTIYATLRKVS